MLRPKDLRSLRYIFVRWNNAGDWRAARLIHTVDGGHIQVMFADRTHKYSSIDRLRDSPYAEEYFMREQASHVIEKITSW